MPSEGELRIAKAQLVGWLEGLFHGIQATLMAQQFAARQQFEQMRELPAARLPPQPGADPTARHERPSTYLETGPNPTERARHRRVAQR